MEGDKSSASRLVRLFYSDRQPWKHHMGDQITQQRHLLHNQRRANNRTTGHRMPIIPPLLAPAA